MDIVDLHCDLLCYLALDPKRDPLNPVVRCSGPQLKAGNVKLQVMAIFAETNLYSVLYGQEQLKRFIALPTQYPDYFTKDSILPAFESASAFALEAEPFDHVLERLESILTQINPLYISITWNGENRFGGGCGSDKGLKSDGAELLKFLSGRNIAIDFSHASDRLAYDILNAIDKHHLDLQVMASHSNFRPLLDQPRNLPDDLAREIIQRKGLIGLNFYKKFLETPSQLYQMIDYAFQLGGAEALAFGADFFCLDDLHTILTGPSGFFDEMSDSSKYPSILEGIRREVGLSEEQVENIASKNALRFIENNQSVSL